MANAAQGSPYGKQPDRVDFIPISNQPDRVDFIPIDKIRENPVALRSVDRESKNYLNLVDSVKKQGILTPILVREFRNQENPEEILYVLIEGLQRYNAALDAGLKEMPAKITDMTQAEIEEAQITANVQRFEMKSIQF